MVSQLSPDCLLASLSPNCALVVSLPNRIENVREKFSMQKFSRKHFRGHQGERGLRSDVPLGLPGAFH